MNAKIINQPVSGKFKERIYDIENPWNSQSWTWVKFTDAYSIETVGQFRGAPVKVKYSKKRNEIIVLTSDHVFRLKASNLNLIETDSQTEYLDLEVSPDGDFFFHNRYKIIKLNSSLTDISYIDSPFEMDNIRFLNWKDTTLLFECEEFANWQRSEIMELDTVQWNIKPLRNKAI